ncbi:hypothetical protein Tco_0995033, partial [Tanacetum coccineum]
MGRLRLGGGLSPNVDITTRADKDHPQPYATDKRKFNHRIAHTSDPQPIPHMLLPTPMITISGKRMWEIAMVALNRVLQ